MSISSEIRRAGPFAGNGSTVNFPFTFKVFTTAQVLVTRTVSGVETVLTLTTDYTVSLNSNQDTSPGGTVTMLVAPATGQSITITSNVLNLQPTVLANLGGFYPEVINDSLDRATIQIQQLDERLDRALVIPVSSSGVNTQLPAPTASSLIGWNTLGTGLQNYSNIPVGSTIYQYVHQTTAIAGQTVVGLPVNYTLGTNAITVFLNGLRVEPTLDYAETNTTTITFNSGLSAGDLVIVAIHGNLTSGILTLAPVLGAVSSLNFASGDYIEATGSATFRARKLTAATYAALTAIPAASRHDDMLVYVASRATDGDGGEGYWRFDAASSATANGGTILAPDAGTGRWIRQYTGAVYSEWFGAKGDGTTDDTVAIQAALTALRLQGGGVLEFVADRTYMFSAPLLVGSGTWVRGGGWTSILKASNAFQTGSWNSYSDPTPGGLVNYNSQASSFLDSNIWVSDFKIDMNVTQTYALYTQIQACVIFRKVRGVQVHRMWLTDCSNGTALINCEDTVTTDTLVTRLANAGIDHWEGSKRCKVSNCTVLGWCDANFDYTAPPAGITPVQGIQFTGTGSFDDNNYVTEDVTCIGCTVKFLPATNASGIIANANEANSRVDNARFIGNDVEDCYLPIVFSGRGSGHVASDNNIHDSTGAGIYAAQAAFGHAPTGVRITGNYFKNVTTTAGVGQVLIGSNGDDGYYEGNVAESCTYAHGFFFDGDDNQIGQQNMPVGSSSVLISDSGSGNTYGQIRQLFNAAAVLEFGGASAGITSTTARLDYVKIGRRIDFNFVIFLTSKGSSTGVAEIELPYAALTSSSGSIGYFANMVGPPTLMNWVINANGTALRIFKDTATAATDADFNNNSELIISGSYIINSAG